jgi:membrane protein implicated in regulation of membrane protease activity
MDFSSLLSSLPLTWLIIGVILLCIEIIVPVAIFLWLGVAAVILSGVVSLVSLSLNVQIIAFAALAPLITILGRRLIPFHLKNRHEENMSRKIDQMIGLTFVLSSDLKEGRAQARVGDSVWPVKSLQSLKKNDSVKVVGIEQNTLIIEKNASE